MSRITQPLGEDVALILEVGQVAGVGEFGGSQDLQHLGEFLIDGEVLACFENLFDDLGFLRFLVAAARQFLLEAQQFILEVGELPGELLLVGDEIVLLDRGCNFLGLVLGLQRINETNASRLPYPSGPESNATS